MEPDHITASSTETSPAGIPTRRHKNPVLPVVAVLSILGLVTVIVMKMKIPNSVASSESTFTVKRGDLSVSVTEAGSVRARNSINYNCEVSRRGGDLTILDIVPAGTYITQEEVANGKVLVELDASVLSEQLTRSRLDLATEQENLISAREANDIQVLQNESDIAASQLKVRVTSMAIQKYLGTRLANLLTEGVRHDVHVTEYVTPFVQRVRDDPNLLEGSAASQELQRLKDAIVLAEGSLKTAEATLVGTERLHDANYVSDLDLQRDRLAVTDRRFSLNSAIVSLNLFLQYDFPINVEQYLSDYIEVQRQLGRTHAQCRSRLAQTQARLSDAHEHVVEEIGTVKRYEELIAKCKIRAKAPGLVIYGTGTSSDAYTAMRGGRGTSSGIIAAGETVYEGQTLMSMPDTASMIAEISVHETEVDKVRPGQTARITPDAFPDRVLQGHVLEVAPLPDNQQGFLNPDLKVYKTLVSIDGSYEFLKIRMSCRVNILVSELKDVIQVPIQVVANRRGKKVLYVIHGSDIQEREVKTGVFNDTFVEITEGLDEGEKVLLNLPPESF